jgi:ABC-type bacteriocin/lantibiotic exporter with double-glycine peptidase domain
MERLKEIGIIIAIFTPLILGYILGVKSWWWLLIAIVQIALILLVIKISGKGFSGLKF